MPTERHTPVKVAEACACGAAVTFEATTTTVAALWALVAAWRDEHNAACRLRDGGGLLRLFRGMPPW